MMQYYRYENLSSRKEWNNKTRGPKLIPGRTRVCLGRHSMYTLHAKRYATGSFKDPSAPWFVATDLYLSKRHRDALLAAVAPPSLVGKCQLQHLIEFNDTALQSSEALSCAIQANKS
eukprot:scaffold86919_cov22-Prasinocladus_malaysianus.AAC.1